MSSISFDATLNTAQLETAIRNSNKTVGDWAKNVEKAGGQADAGLSKMTKSFKEAITEQKALIKSIEQDVKRLQKVYDDATAGRAKQAAGGDLRSAKRALTEEQGTLLGLQKQQIESNNKEAASTEGIIGKLKGWVLGLATVGAALKIAKGIIASSASSADRFKEILGGAKAATDYFFKSIASGDFSNFFNGMDKAIKAGVEYERVMSSIENRRNEAAIKQSELDVKISSLRIDTFDKTDSNNLNRLKKLDEIISLLQEKFKETLKLNTEAFDVTVKRAATQSKLSEGEIKNLLHEYTSLEKVIELGEKYNENKKLIRNPNIGNQFRAELQKENDAMGAGAEKLGEYARRVGRISDEERASITKLWVDVSKAQKAFDDSLGGGHGMQYASQRAQVWDEMKKKWYDEIEAENKVWEERNDIGKKIAEQEKLLNDAIIDGSEKEIKAIAARIVELNKELEVREKIARQVIEAAAYEGFAPTQIVTGGFKVPTVFPKIKKPTGYKTPEQVNQEMQNLRPLSKAYEEATKKQKILNNLTDDELDKRNKILDSVSSLVMQLGQASGMDEKTLSGLGTSLNMFTSALSGDWVGAVSSILSNLISLIPDEAAKFQDQIDAINLALKEQQRLIEKSSRTGGGKEAREKYIQGLEDKEKEIYKALNYAAGQGKPIDALLESLLDVRAAIQDAGQELEDFLRGGITGNTIADAIAQGFLEGKTSVNDFATYMNDILTDAVMRVFTESLLSSENLKAYLVWLKEAMSGGITPEEAKRNAEWVAQIAAENKANYEAMTSGLNLGGNAANAGLSGGIARQITEETGTELAGLFRRFADDERLIRDYNKMGVAHLVGIEANTYGSWMELQKVNTKLDTVITNTKQVPVGAL